MTRGRRERELFVWYRVDAARALAAAAAVQAMQRTLVSRWPRLRARLLVRSDGDEETWMEAYALAPSNGDAGGLTDELAAAIEAAASMLQPFIAGGRHVEAFDVVPDP